jgi:hypothetical protein
VEHRHAHRLDQYLLKKARFGFFRLKVYRRFPAKAFGDSYTPPSMGVQIALAGLAGVLGCLMVARLAGAGRGLAIVMSMFACTTAPFTWRAGAQDGLLLAVLAPWLSFARSFAQGCGVLLALLADRPGPAATGREQPRRFATARPALSDVTDLPCSA